MAKLLIPFALSAPDPFGLTSISGPAGPSPASSAPPYQVLPQGLAWQQSIRTLEGKETQASAPELNLFPKPASKTRLRMLFLTRASDQNYNTALLYAANPKALDAFTAAVRANPDQACQASCIWIPPGVAARPEKPSGKGTFIPAL